MKKYRLGVFETNSSTSHSLVIMSKEDAWRWKNNPDLWVVKDGYWYGLDNPPTKGKLYTTEELIDIFSKGKYQPKTAEEFTYDNEGFESYDEYIKSYLSDEGMIRYEDWNEIELEHDDEEFVSPSGDKMVAYSVYGTEY